MTSSRDEKRLWPTSRQVLGVVGLFTAIALLAVAAPGPPSPEPPAYVLRLPWVVFLGAAFAAIRRARSLGASRATQAIYAGSIYLGLVFLNLAVVAIAWTFGAEPGESIADNIGRVLVPSSPDPAGEVLRLVGIAILLVAIVGVGIAVRRYLYRDDW